MIDERFVLESQLNDGPLGAVYRATDKHAHEGSTTRRVALWLLPSELTSNKAALELFVNDVLVLRDLHHESVVRIYDYGCAGDAHFVTSELLDGEPLRRVVDYLRPERPDDNEIDEVLGGIGDGLAYLHEHGVVHGDVRAENVLVTMDQRFKLINLVGTNLLNTSISTEPRSDVRGFAAMAYELYAGQPVPLEGRLEGIERLGGRRRKALENALSNNPAYRDLTMRDLLEDAGLARRPSHGAAVPRPKILPKRPARWTLPALPAWRLPAVTGIAVAAALVAYTDGRIGPWVEAARERVAALSLAGPSQTPPTQAIESAPVGGMASSAESKDRRSHELAEAPSIEPLPTPAADAPSIEPAHDPTPAADPDPEPAAEAAAPATDYRALSEAPEERAVETPPASESPARPSLSLSSATLVARESHGGVSIDVVRAGDDSVPIEFVWWTSDDTAVAGDDYASFGRRVETLQAGESMSTLYVPLTHDVLPEPDERFFIHLAIETADAEVGDVSTAQVTIIDDD